MLHTCAALPRWSHSSGPSTAPLNITEILKYPNGKDYTVAAHTVTSQSLPSLIHVPYHISLHLFWLLTNIRGSSTIYLKGKRPTTKQHAQYDLTYKNIDGWVRSHVYKKQWKEMPENVTRNHFSIYIYIYECVCGGHCFLSHLFGQSASSPCEINPSAVKGSTQDEGKDAGMNEGGMRGGKMGNGQEGNSYKPSIRWNFKKCAKMEF